MATDPALDILQSFLGRSRPSDDTPTPPGPWDPVIRDLAAHVRVLGPSPQPWRTRFGPQPEPWRYSLDPIGGTSWGEVFGPFPDSWREAVIAAIARKHPEVWDVVGGWGSHVDAVALNPQPLPPRWAFTAALGEAAVRRAELIADLGRATGSEGAVARYVAELVDDYCGNGRIPWPWPRPRPNWLIEDVTGADLVIMAGVFSTASHRVRDEHLQRSLADGAAKLAETGVAQLG